MVACSFFIRGNCRYGRSCRLSHNQADVYEQLMHTGECELSEAPAELRNNLQIVLAAVKRKGQALQYASAALQADFAVVLAAVEKNPSSMVFAAKSIRADPINFVLYGIRNSHFPAKFLGKQASPAMRNNRELILEAVKKDWRSLAHASQKLKNDRQVVFAAVEKCGLAFEYASSALQNDREVVLAALKLSRLCFEHASQTLKNDREVVLEAVKLNGNSINLASAALQRDREVVIAALSAPFFSTTIQGCQRVQGCQYLDQLEVYKFAYSSQELMSDKDFVLQAIKSNGVVFPVEILKHCSTLFRTDKDVLFLALQKLKELQESYPGERTLSAYENIIFEFIPASHKLDKAFVLDAVKHYGLVLKFTSVEIQQDMEVLSIAVQSVGAGPLLFVVGKSWKSEAEMIVQVFEAELYRQSQLKAAVKQVSRAPWLPPLRPTYYPATLTSTRYLSIAETMNPSWREFLNFFESPYSYSAPFPEVLIKINSALTQGNVLRALMRRFGWDSSMFIKRGEFSHTDLHLQNREVVLIAVEYSNEALTRTPPILKKDKAFMTQIISNDGMALRYADPELQADRDVVFAAVNQCGDALQHASKTILTDIELVLAAVKQKGTALQFASSTQVEDRVLVLEAVKQSGKALKYASSILQGDREVVHLAVSSWGMALQYASSSLREDREVVLAAVNQCGSAFEYASENLKEDGEFVKAVTELSGLAHQHAASVLKRNRDLVLVSVKQCGQALSNTSEFQNDREIVLAAVRQDGRAIRYASQLLRADKEVALEAVRQCGNALEYVSPQLQEDRQVVVVAVNQSGMALKFASSVLQSDREVVLLSVQQTGKALEHASSGLKEDRDIVLTAVRNNREAFFLLHPRFQDDKEVVLAAVKSSGDMLKYASPALRADREVVLASVRSCAHSLVYASPGLRADRDVVLSAVEQNGAVLEYSARALQSDPGIVLTAVSQSGLALQHASFLIKNDRDVVLKAIQQNGLSIQYASANLKDDRDLVLSAVQANGEALQYLSFAFKEDREIVLAAVKSNEKAWRHSAPALLQDREFLMMAALDNESMKFRANSVRAKGDQLSSLVHPHQSCFDLVAGLRNQGYRYICDLGAGGQGTIYLAENVGSNQKVAIKVLNMESSRPAWLRELTNLKKLRHSSIPLFLDGLQLCGDRYALVMEYIPGVSLREFLNSRSALPWKGTGDWDASSILVDLLRALSELHSHRPPMVHRDVKPENVMLSADKRIVLVDFGLSKCHESAQTLTGTGEFKGTPLYMSPECFNVIRELDERIDVWSSGIILFEMLEGRPPFQNSSVWDIALQIKHFQFKPLSCPLGTVNDSVKRIELQLFMKKMLEVDRKLRFRNATHCLAALQNVLLFVDEADYFACMRLMMIELLPTVRNLFHHHWRLTVGEVWVDCEICGNKYFEMESNKHRWAKWISDAVKGGNTIKWDFTIFCNVLLWSTVCPLPEECEDRRDLLQFRQWRNELAHWKPGDILDCGFEACASRLRGFLARHQDALGCEKQGIPDALITVPAFKDQLTVLVELDRELLSMSLESVSDNQSALQLHSNSQEVLEKFSVSREHFINVFNMPVRP